ncbi:MAG: hypothetical protein LBU64_07965 [Planctomycetota bacterium]|jgi:hypothetical protein|nr:hypothetical protein [Planctomycetota bacterium]
MSLAMRIARLESASGNPMPDAGGGGAWIMKHGDMDAGARCADAAIRAALGGDEEKAATAREAHPDLFARAEAGLRLVLTESPI